MSADPAVTRRKFGRELRRYIEQAEYWRKRGVWLLCPKFPKPLFAFGTPNVWPVQVLFAVEIDFEGYDSQPLGVKLVHPCTRQPLRWEDLIRLFPADLPQLPGNTNLFTRYEFTPPNHVAFHNFVQGAPGVWPFLCLQGVREYHSNTAHSGDSWLLYRGTEVGSLNQILDILATYGAEPARSIRMAMQLAGLHAAQVLTQ